MNSGPTEQSTPAASSAAHEMEKRYHLLFKTPDYEGIIAVGSMRFMEEWRSGQLYTWLEYVRPDEWRLLDQAGQFTWAEKNQPECCVRISYYEPDTRSILKRVWDFFT